MPPFIFLYLLVALVLPQFLHAQQPQIHTVKFSTLSWSRMIQDLHFRGSDGETVKIWIPNGSPSKGFEYQGTLPVRFFRIVGKDLEGNPIEEVAAEYSPRGGAGEQLLVFLEEDSSDAVRYRLLPIEFSVDAIVENEYRFINLSTFPVYIKFGSARFKVEPRGEQSMTTEIPVGGGQPVAMAIQVSEQPNDVKIAYSTSWAVREGRSSLVFITTDPRADERIKVKMLYF